LVAGLIWLIGLWLLLGEYLPRPQDAVGVLSAIYRLIEAVGQTPALAAATVAGYLVGVLSEVLSSALLGVIVRSGRMRMSGVGRLTIHEAAVIRLDQVLSRDGEARQAFLADPITAELATMVSLSVPMRTRHAIIERRVDVERCLRDLEREFALVPMRLLGREPELFGEYDRLRAEGEFRSAVAFALCVNLMVLGSYGRLPLLIAAPGVLLGVLLFAAGVGRLTAAHDTLAAALRSDRLEMQTFHQYLGGQLPLRRETASAEYPGWVLGEYEIQALRAIVGGRSERDELIRGEAIQVLHRAAGEGQAAASEVYAMLLMEKGEYAHAVSVIVDWADHDAEGAAGFCWRHGVEHPQLNLLGQSILLSLPEPRSPGVLRDLALWAERLEDADDALGWWLQAAAAREPRAEARVLFWSRRLNRPDLVGIVALGHRPLREYRATPDRFDMSDRLAAAREWLAFRLWPERKWAEPAGEWLNRRKVASELA
jgi:hypothetical protein